MELVSQHVKGIMEECKLRARDNGLKFDNETLEYIVTNRDMIELSPKVMIPTLYDYWVHDVRVLSGKGMYEAYPSNPYETVINTRPAISFYNDNNPDWLNVMIFYHVLGHIDFFQNNLFYKNTWDIDLAGQALADKRLIAQFRSEKGRWLDYAIEFSRGIDNLVGYNRELNRILTRETGQKMDKTDFYFDWFLQKVKRVPQHEYLKEINRYNGINSSDEDFFDLVLEKYPEFQELYKRQRRKRARFEPDVMQYIIWYSGFLKDEENKWMKSVMEIVRNTSLYFQPQIRTKIMNEGWASYWHEYLFMKDDRISGHETDFSLVNAKVTSMPKVGLNPYALGLRMFQDIKEKEDRGCFSFDYRLLKDEVKRKNFNTGKESGDDYIFDVRENYNDFTFINTFIDQDFVDRHKLFVAGKYLDQQSMSWKYYIKSKKAQDYKQMVVDSLYHPPQITVDTVKSKDGILYLNHTFEHKPLKQDYIENTMIGIEYLWGGPVHLETSEPVMPKTSPPGFGSLADQGAAAGKPADAPKKEIQWKRMRYQMENRKLHKREL